MAAVAIVSLVALAYIVQSSAPPNVVHLPLQERARPPVTAVMPESFGFFGEDYQHSHLSAYRVVGGRLELIDRGVADASLATLRFDRTVRDLRQEMAGVAALAEDEGVAFVPCRGALGRCVADLEPQPFRTRAHEPLICGDVAIARARPPVWPSRADVGPGAEVMRLVVAC